MDSFAVNFQEELGLFSIMVAQKLKELPPDQRILAEKIISEIVFYGQLGYLSKRLAKNFLYLLEGKKNDKQEPTQQQQSRPQTPTRNHHAVLVNHPPFTPRIEVVHYSQYPSPGPSFGQQYNNMENVPQRVKKICPKCDKVIPASRDVDARDMRNDQIKGGMESRPSSGTRKGCDCPMSPIGSPTRSPSNDSTRWSRSRSTHSFRSRSGRSKSRDK